MNELLHSQSRRIDAFFGASFGSVGVISPFLGRAGRASQRRRGGPCISVLIQTAKMEIPV